MLATISNRENKEDKLNVMFLLVQKDLLLILQA